MTTPVFTEKVSHNVKVVQAPSAQVPALVAEKRSRRESAVRALCLVLQHIAALAQFLSLVVLSLAAFWHFYGGVWFDHLLVHRMNTALLFESAEAWWYEEGFEKSPLAFWFYLLFHGIYLPRGSMDWSHIWKKTVFAEMLCVIVFFACIFMCAPYFLWCAYKLWRNRRNAPRPVWDGPARNMLKDPEFVTHVRRMGCACAWEKIKKRCAEISVFDDVVLRQNCPTCRAFIMYHFDDTVLAQVLDGFESFYTTQPPEFFTPHTCCRDGDFDHISELLCFLRNACWSAELDGKPEADCMHEVFTPPFAEGRNTSGKSSKFYKRVDAKHYKRGGKRIQLSTQDYDKIFELVMDQDFRAARDLLNNAIDDEYAAHQGGRGQDGNVVALREAMRAQDQALRMMAHMVSTDGDRSLLQGFQRYREDDQEYESAPIPKGKVALTTAVAENAPAVGATKAVATPPAAPIGATKAVATPPAVPIVTNLPIWDDFTKAKLVQFLEMNEISHAVHDAETQKRNPTGVVACLPEASSSSNVVKAKPAVFARELAPSVDEVEIFTPATRVAPAKQQDKKQKVRKPKPTVVQQVQQAESYVPGCKPAPISANSRCVVTPAGRTMNGLLWKGAAAKSFFVTGRHAIVDETMQDGAKDFTVGTVLKMYEPLSDQPIEVVVKACLGTGDDRLVLEFDTPAAPIKFEAKVQIGESVTAAYMVPDGGRHIWRIQSGNVEDITNTGIILIRWSTAPGACRMAVYNRAGAVIGGHFWSGVKGSQSPDKLPGADPEDGSVPKTFNAEYRFSGMAGFVPQGINQQVAEENSLVDMGVVGKRLRVEAQKFYKLRKDKKLAQIRTDHFMMKPSTSMLHQELLKFGERDPRPLDKEALRLATMGLLMLEAEVAKPFLEPTLDNFVACALGMASDNTMAGSSAVGSTHTEYLTDNGRRTLEQGAAAIGYDVWRAYQFLAGKIPSDDDIEQTLLLMKVWCVHGKKDGYTLKKLDVGRSIQAPDFELKLLWFVCFHEGDERWIRRDDIFRAGANYDMPVPKRRVAIYKRALGCLGLDESAFDRRMRPEFMEIFFKQYLLFLNPMCPRGLLDHLADVTIYSFLMTSDGHMFSKKQGNPSGFPNTLRLNCIVQLLAWLYFAVLRFRDMHSRLPTEDELLKLFDEHSYLEICGDDSRLWILTTYGAEFFGMHTGFDAVLDGWQKWLPWAVKIEGKCIFDHTQSLAARMRSAPPLISRNLVIIDGFLWSPLYNPNRVLRRLVHHEEKQPTEELVTSAQATLCLHMYWHLTGKAQVPTVEFLLANWPELVDVDFINSLAAHSYQDALINVGPADLC